MDASAVKTTIGIERVAMPFELRQPDEIAAFIRAHPVALDLIRLAVERLPDYFPDDVAEVAVEIDPDEPEDPSLLVTVRTRSNHEFADAALSRFDRDWWIPRIEALLPMRAPVLVTVRHG